MTQELVHVTSVLQFVGIRSSFEFLKPDDRTFYLERGKMIHYYTELFDNGEINRYDLDERIVPYIEAYKLFREEVGGKILHREQKVVSDLLGYEGRLDRVIKGSHAFKGEVIADIKTNEGDIATRLQLSAYQLAYANTKNWRKTRRAVIELKDNGKYRFEMYSEADNDSDMDGWLSALKLCKWKMRHEVMPKREEEKADERATEGSSRDT
jgi:hypothetical protein